MEHHGRRRGRPRTEHLHSYHSRQKKSSFFHSLCSFVIMSCLMAIIYLLLEHHCTMCSNKCDLHNISKGIESISNNLTLMKHSYNDLETKIFKFSQELPKLEGQVDVLESLALTIKNRDFGWTPITTLSVNDYLPKQHNQCFTKLYNESFNVLEAIHD
ncbi:unnamed protein product [Leptidea sinapis]|uniref:Uncharacterized protein n=1 Tax=Leptidea sinapis TaxID=189913 RepID=A0A5E4PUB3_9NEOP|nr:unnamed protein product [Leptidea sinapis]